jgi:hypothetical protein
MELDKNERKLRWRNCKSLNQTPTQNLPSKMRRKIMLNCCHVAIAGLIG